MENFSYDSFRIRHRQFIREHRFVFHLSEITLSDGVGALTLSQVNFEGKFTAFFPPRELSETDCKERIAFVSMRIVIFPTLWNALNVLFNIFMP